MPDAPETTLAATPATPPTDEATVTENAVAAAQAAAEPAAPVIKKGVVIVGNHKIPEGVLSIVVEKREVSGEGADRKVTLITEGYPAKADLYFRTDPAVTFAKELKGEILTLGDNVQQAAFWGFVETPGWVNVGPAHPAYAAANVLWQRGCTDIEFIGLSDAEKAQLKTWTDVLTTEGGPPPVGGAPDVRAPADVKITLS